MTGLFRVFVLVGLIACTASSSAARPLQSVAAASLDPALKARVKQYWALKQQKDLAGMYELYGSVYRGETSRLDFLAMSRLVRYPILAFEVTSAEVDGDRASVTITYESELPVKAIPRYETDVTHGWIRENGEWWKADEEVLLPVP